MKFHKKFHSQKEFILLNEGVENNSIPDESLDLAMSLGVLHHIPDTKKAIRDICKKVKPGGIFLCYLYYKLEDKPIHYRTLFIFVNFVRKLISRLPNKIRMILAKFIALTIYLPLAGLAKWQTIRGRDTSNFPLHHYADMPFVMLENDALDRADDHAIGILATEAGFGNNVSH